MPDFDNLTICIKAFERPHCCHRLVDSIRAMTKDTRILIADDSRVPIERNDATVMPLEFDVGISVGRNAMVEAVDTEYLLLLDDDVVFTHRTHLGETLDIIQDTQLDILGMRQIGTGPYEGVFKLQDDRLHVSKAKRGMASVLVSLHDIIHNTFVARTESLLEHPWDADFKMAEHIEFFYNHLGKLSVGYYVRAAVKHLPDKTDPLYMKYRNRGRYYGQQFLRKHNLQGVVSEIGPSYEREQDASREATPSRDN